MADDPDLLERVEDALAREAGLEPGELLLDFPARSSMLGVDLPLRHRGGSVERLTDEGRAGQLGLPRVADELYRSARRLRVFVAGTAANAARAASPRPDHDARGRNWPPAGRAIHTAGRNRPMISRRTFVGADRRLHDRPRLGGRRLWALPSAAETITVFKSRSCGCCAEWVDHLKAEGFATVVHDEDEMDMVKDNLGVPGKVRSCHTGQVGKYLVEGHVPPGISAGCSRRSRRSPGSRCPACRRARRAWRSRAGRSRPAVRRALRSPSDGKTTSYARH